MTLMTTVSDFDLREDFRRIVTLLREGEEIRVTQSRKTIARLIPEPHDYPLLPDFAEGVRKIYGDKVSEMQTTDVSLRSRLDPESNLKPFPATQLTRAALRNAP